MLGSIYIGLSGLGAYSRGLQLISNNVANMNAQGFVSSQITFDDLVGSRGTGSSYDFAGSSGYGVGIGRELLNFTQGELRQTDRDLDLAVDGSGFLMLIRGDEVAYTRTGSFEVDESGHIKLSGTDYQLAMLDDQGRPVSASVNTQATSAPQASKTVTFTGNLASDATSFSVSDIKVVDPTGAEHTWTATFKQNSRHPGRWSVELRDADADPSSTPIVTKTILIEEGKVTVKTAKQTFTDAEASLSVMLDLTGITAFDTNGVTSTLRTASIDGYGTGSLASVAVNDAGQIELSYSNQQKATLGAIAIADFRNPQALSQHTGGLFTVSGDAGRELLTSGGAQAGKVLGKRLEASNVDLSKEFGDLILIQRGFQASSQIISVTNDMIQQLFGIRGQG